jgi:hypothetical protein
MKKLIILLVAFSLSSCAMLKAQEEEDEKIAKQEKYEFTKFVCSVYNDFHSKCDRHLKTKADFEVCNESTYEFQGVLAQYQKAYDERFNFKVCKQFAPKKIIKKSKKKVNK